jgi:hypothetical protein
MLLLVGLLAALGVAATAIVGARTARPLVEHGVFEPTGALVASYVEGRTVTILADGRVLIAGRVAGKPAGKAELYDPAMGAFVATGDMVEPDGGSCLDGADVLPVGPGLGATPRRQGPPCRRLPGLRFRGGRTHRIVRDRPL